MRISHWSSDVFSSDRDLAHAGELVASKRFQHADSLFAQLGLFRFVEAGKQGADLARQLAAHLVVIVVGKEPAGGLRRGGVAQDRKSDGEGKRGSDCVNLGGSRIPRRKNNTD